MASSPDQKTFSTCTAANRFTGRVAIVTGGASGIGKATVERLASEGATVAIFDINKTAGEQVSTELCSKGFDVRFFEVDVSDKEKCVEAVKKYADDNNGTINYLVNCAAYFGSKGLTAEKKDWDKCFSVNVQGYANMVQACYEYMKQLSVDKSVVNIASVSGYISEPNQWTYNSTKGAVLTMTKCMALDLSKDGIRVNSISPAVVWTPQQSKIAGGDREKCEFILGPCHMPRRICECSEVAAATCFLLSEDASFITGADLPVDGGYMAMGPEGLGEKSVFAGTEY